MLLTQVGNSRALPPHNAGCGVPWLFKTNDGNDLNFGSLGASLALLFRLYFTARLMTNCLSW